MYYRRKKNQKRAFTLIELLVVIAIIALLLAIIMPSLSAAKKRVYTVTCLSNQRQIGFATSLYSNDYKERIPRGDGGGAMIWYTRVLPYIGQDQDLADFKRVGVYRCRAFPKNGTGSNNLPNSRQTIGYVVNAWGFNGRSDTVGYEISTPTKTTRFRSPSSKVYLTDNEAGSWRPVVETLETPLPIDAVRFDIYSNEHLPMSTNETDQAYGRRIARDRHGDGCNLLFLDWHAESVNAKEVTMNMFRER
jgi:prepilin-type N-terminal cleavage/methylation domain-containing protein/prepilin-type processing-associated H-X9-DG protein